MQLPAAGVDPCGRARLSYQQAAALFSEASGGATLHQLRHSALTHEAEKGTGTPMLIARSGHTSVRSRPNTREYRPKRSPAIRPSTTRRGDGKGNSGGERQARIGIGRSWPVSK